MPNTTEPAFVIRHVSAARQPSQENGSYDEDVEQAIREARAAFNFTMATTDGGSGGMIGGGDVDPATRLAVVFDIDETALCNIKACTFCPPPPFFLVCAWRLSCWRWENQDNLCIPPAAERFLRVLDFRCSGAQGAARTNLLRERRVDGAALLM